MASGRVGRVWRQGVGAGDGCGDEGLVVVWSGWSGCLIYVMGPFEDVVGSRPVSSLLEPPGNRPVVFEGVVKMCPHPRFYQPVMDPFLGVIPLGPISAQLAISFFQLLFIEGRPP